MFCRVCGHNGVPRGRRLSHTCGERCHRKLRIERKAYRKRLHERGVFKPRRQAAVEVVEKALDFLFRW